MNSSRYLIARLALSFGIRRKTKRLSEAAEEMHLLRQAEEILGRDVWEQAEEIEAIDVEYWTLRKLALKLRNLEKSIDSAEEVIDTSHDERNAALNATNQACLVLEKKRDELMGYSKELLAERDQVIARAQKIRRKFDASRTKVQVLSGEGGNAETIKEEQKKMAAYKVDFSGLKNEREEVSQKIQKLDAKLTKVDASIAEDRKKLRDDASTAYQSMGKANRDRSKLTSEIGLLEVEMKSHYIEIGRYISNEVGNDPLCAKIHADHAHLVAQMQSLRSSIALNQRLAAMAGA
ncbi:MAG: hypothetical protein KJO21_10985 [Verrucomicrobiae bacterium]|nr:hypothetical protein [Verrucomicrobiae bacterium]NNJ42810.1 hypothetical protein [Akkermansiaceae bacterium]